MIKHLHKLLPLVGVLATLTCLPADASWITTITASNPLDWYQLNETSGTTAFDSGSAHLNGSFGVGVQAPTLGVAGIAGTGVQFDGDQDTVLIQGSDVSGDWTAEFVVKRTAANFSSNLIRDDSTPGTSLKLEQYDNTGQPGFTQNGQSNYTFSPAVPSPPIGQFVDLVYVNKAGSGMSLYMNGALAGTSPNNISLARYRLGSTDNETPKAVMDEVVLYNRALSSTEIASHAATLSLLGISTDTSWRSIGPVGNQIGQNFSTAGASWESTNTGWNTSLAYSDTANGWHNAIQNDPTHDALRIWTDGNNDANASTPAYFRKIFNIPGTPTQGTINFVVDDDLQLYVNGTLVYTDTDTVATTVNDLDVTSYLHSGQNLIAVKAHNMQGAEGLDLTFTAAYVATPEPSSFVLCGLGLLGILAVARRKSLGAIGVTK